MTTGSGLTGGRSVLVWISIHANTSTVLPRPISSANIPPGGIATASGLSRTSLSLIELKTKSPENLNHNGQIKIYGYMHIHTFLHADCSKEVGHLKLYVLRTKYVIFLQKTIEDEILT